MKSKEILTTSCSSRNVYILNNLLSGKSALVITDILLYLRYIFDEKMFYGDWNDFNSLNIYQVT